MLDIQRNIHHLDSMTLHMLFVDRILPVHLYSASVRGPLADPDECVRGLPFIGALYRVSLGICDRALSWEPKAYMILFGVVFSML